MGEHPSGIDFGKMFEEMQETGEDGRVAQGKYTNGGVDTVVARVALATGMAIGVESDTLDEMPESIEDIPVDEVMTKDIAILIMETLDEKEHQFTFDVSEAARLAMALNDWLEVMMLKAIETGECPSCGGQHGFGEDHE